MNAVNDIRAAVFSNGEEHGEAVANLAWFHEQTGMVLNSRDEDFVVMVKP